MSGKRISSTYIHYSLNQSGYGCKILVPIHHFEQFKTLLPDAIEIACRRYGKIILLNIIEIPYQLPPSAAKRFVLERELFLMNGMAMLKSAECVGEIAVRIAHQTNDAIERFAKNEKINIIVRDSSQIERSTFFKRLKNSFKEWCKVQL